MSALIGRIRALADFLLLPVQALLRHRVLIMRLTVRDVAARYRGSALGVAWSVLAPLLQLAVFTFFFGVVFRARWSAGAEGGIGDFAIFAFAGLVVHGYIAELLGRANGLVRNHPSFVKRVIFPLEALVWVPVLGGLFHFVAYLAVLILAAAIFKGDAGWFALGSVLWILPMVLLAAGVGWVLAAIGVFFRDVGQIIPFVSTMLLYVSPVFYPINAVPAVLRPVLTANPLATVIEGLRTSAISGNPFDWPAFLSLCGGAWLFAAAGCWLFRRLSPTFADII